MEDISRTMVFLRNNAHYLEQLRKTKKYWFIFRFNRNIREKYTQYTMLTDPVEKCALCAEIINLFQKSVLWKIMIWVYCLWEDIRVFFRQFGKRQTIDNSQKNRKDYYSVAVILKNEARYIREYVLFYQSTGADRVYIYDNDSDDNLLEAIEPFLKSGFVVYRKWPGRKVHTAAYRDVVRRTKNKTKWLALVDSDEFLFSPISRMPEQLHGYEDYPGIGVNWVVFGPNGHQKSPDGLVMDNYTTALMDYDAMINCHIKSIVQPRQVYCVCHTHFCIYKKGRYAVDTCRKPIDNYNAYRKGAGRAFTPKNYRDVFRINHYRTRSLEDLRNKCARGTADGAPDKDFQIQLRPFEAPLVEDKSIIPYADMVRERINEL